MSNLMARRRRRQLYRSAIVQGSLVDKPNESKHPFIVGILFWNTLVSLTQSEVAAGLQLILTVSN